MMPAKKLLQINPVIRQNTSTGRIMREIGEVAMKNGWESYIAYSKARDGVPVHSSRLVPVGNKISLAIHALATRLFDAHGLASRRATRQLIKQIRELDPDIVHIHNIHGYFLNYPLLCKYLRESGKPVIWTVHDCWLYTGHCYYYSAAACDKWKSGCGHCPQKHAFPASWGLDRSARNWKDKQSALCALPRFTVVPVSQWIREEMKSSFLAGKDFRVIHNGIDLSVFTPQAAVKSKHTLYLGVSTIWYREKGFDDLISLAGRLQDDEQLILVGRTTEEQKRRLPRHVRLVDRTENVAALAALYASATVFLNPTWQDNYPTVNLEALACGTPVVTYRTGGSPESVTAETGRVVPQGDVEGMLSAARELAGMDREKTACQCREWALQHADKKKCYQEYITLYENLANR